MGFIKFHSHWGLLQFCCSPPILHPLPSSEASLQSPPAHPAALLRSVERALRSAASWTQKMVDRKPWYILWLLVLTILKNISQWEGLSHILWKIKNVWNHQPVLVLCTLKVATPGHSGLGFFQFPGFRDCVVPDLASWPGHKEVFCISHCNGKVWKSGIPLGWCYFWTCSLNNNMKSSLCVFASKYDFLNQAWGNLGWVLYIKTKFLNWPSGACNRQSTNRKWLRFQPAPVPFPKDQSICTRYFQDMGGGSTPFPHWLLLTAGFVHWRNTNPMVDPRFFITITILGYCPF